MKLLKKSVSVLLSVVIVFSLFTIVPFEAFAASEIEYIERSWNSSEEKVEETTKTCTNYTNITSQDDLTIGDGKWYVVNGDATIENRVTVSGTAHIILLSGTLRCMYGIRLSKGNSLFVYPGKNSEGTLNPRTPHDEEANLGGNEGEDCGEFVFYGGTLEAHNYEWCSGGAAIGGGGEGGSCGKLSFYGGTVDATNNGRAPGQKSYGAVIGDGDEANSDNSDCYINIYGGNITADNHAYSNGAGIGGGEDSTGCPVNILGGTITAKAYNGAGIGSGQDGGSSTVTIKNAIVTAESDYGAGIGSGEDSDSESIIIENSYVESASKHNSDSQVGAEGAGIGGGNCGKSKYIKINKSVIIASSGRYGAGIGGGDESDGGTIEITDSCVFAHSAQGGAGIGGGDEKGCDSITLKDSFVVAVTDSDVNESGEKFLKDFGDYYNTIMYSISNPAVTEQAGFYAAGSLTAMAITYLIQGTHTGAGIGSGDSGTADHILIDNCIVMAQAGECAAGIGGGDEGGFGTIDIKNSHIYSQGGLYAAGIGSGDEAEDCGTINITDSDITANGGSEGAGIGTGNDTDETTKINIRNSTVEAHGGDYAAGIGGGDSVDGGTITVSGSTVKAYGGKDAAGIGGGEDGDGGHIEFYNKSNVYAEGKHYGAGIGGGEDASGGFCGIYGDSVVEAVSGGSGNVQSIGHGDCGWYIVSYTSGDLELDSYSLVDAGPNKNSTNSYKGSDRFQAIWKNKYALVNSCPHKNVRWQYDTSFAHHKYCVDCGVRVDFEGENHTWNSNNECTVCGGRAELQTLTFIEKDSSGHEVSSTYHKPKYSYFTLPKCTNVPEGMEFICWVNGASEAKVPGMDVMVYENTFTAYYLPVIDTSYIDSDGNEKTVKARVFSNDTPLLIELMTGGWYVIQDNITVEKHIQMSGHVNLILSDGKTMKIRDGRIGNSIANSFDRNAASLSVYGQQEQSGVFDFNKSDVSVPEIRQYGGVIKNGGNAELAASVHVVRGTLDVYKLSGKKIGHIINGGNTKIGSTIITKPLLLGWTKLTDSITFGNIKVYNDEWNNGSVSISDGQALTDGTNIYTGTLTGEQIASIQGKTLTPFVHDYAEPEWVWSDDYTNATAVFRCRDCDDVQEIDARVAFEDAGKNRTATARCMFNGLEYSTTKTFQIIFDIIVAENSHGTVNADKTSAKAGNRVKLEVTPDDGYVSSALYYTDKNGSKTEIVDNSFKMPESDVTVTADFVPITPMVEPYIDANGEYHLGTVAYAEIDGEPYAVNEDGTIGDLLDSVELSYFDFELLDNDTYRINSYTGPTDTLSELVIPKTFNGKQITVLGNSSTPLIDYAGKAKTQFELTLNENIREIKGYAFYTMWVKKVKGDSSGLNKIGDYAFSWANSPDGYKLDIKLDHEGVISVGTGIFNNMNVTMRLKHATKFNTTSFSAQKVTYDFTDAHTYGDPTWQWADDHSSAKAKFTCTDSRCKHTETVDASVTVDNRREKKVYTAEAEFGGAAYTDVQEEAKTLYDVTVADSAHGSVTADKEQAYEGETVELTPNPEPGYNLSEITVKDASDKLIKISENKFTMPESGVTVSAVFDRKQYAISYADDYDGGWISGPLYADAGEEVTVNCAANTGYEVTKLTYRNGVGEYISIDGNTFIMPASQVKVYASFKKRDINITYEACEGGTVSGPSKAQFNDEVQITITPDEGYIFNNLIVEDEWGETPTLTEKGFFMPSEEVTVTAEFLEIVPAKEPWIDEQGEYHLGNVEYIDCYGDPYSIDENGELGEELESTELSYFDFKLINNDTEYQINYYTGPTDDLTELVIPKTYKGKPITVLGTDNRSAFIANANPKPQFTLTLNENIREIKGYAFYTMWVKQVKGDSSGLNKLGDYAFSWANSPNNYTLDIKLDHEGTVTVGKGIFNNMTVTARIRHATKLSSGSFMQKSISYILTDEAHTYGQPKWTWSDDHGTVTAKFTCTDSRCKHEETVEATVAKSLTSEKTVYTATAELDGKTYTDTKEIDGRDYFIGNSLTLNGDIGVNFFLELTEEEAAKATVSFAWFDKTIEEDQVELVLCGTNTYKVTCPVAVAEMTYTITATLKIDGETVDTDIYSAVEYANKFLSNEYAQTYDGDVPYETLKELVQSMLDYGTRAQVRFDRDTENLANGGNYFFNNEVSIDSNASDMTANLDKYGLTYVGSTVIYLSKTALRHYYKVTDPTLFAKVSESITMDGSPIQYGERGGMIYFEVPEIAAYELDVQHTLTIGTNSYSYSATDYFSKLVASTQNDNAKELAKAAYRYNLKAKAYFG